mmetsp:Transcript_42512/g.89248  ORF Transcript_42512/g.89248 Transcript_42512/m.89248 type:complete len:201 (+) Transcript_42512:1802-2404(+)
MMQMTRVTPLGRACVVPAAPEVCEVPSVPVCVPARGLVFEVLRGQPAFIVPTRHSICKARQAASGDTLSFIVLMELTRTIPTRTIPTRILMIPSAKAQPPAHHQTAIPLHHQAAPVMTPVPQAVIEAALREAQLRVLVGAPPVVVPRRHPQALQLAMRITTARLLPPLTMTARPQPPQVTRKIRRQRISLNWDQVFILIS